MIILDFYLDLRILKNRHGKKTGNEEPKHIAALFEYSYIEGDNLNVEVTSGEETNAEDWFEGENVDDITLDDEFENSDMVI